MEIIKLVGGPVDANCYIVKFNNKAIIIDPCVNIDLIKKAVGDNEVIFITITHGHFDHIYCLKEVMDYYNVKLYLAKNAIFMLEDENKNCSSLMGMSIKMSFDKDRLHIVNDYERINIDNHIITFIHTPGHTNDSICIRIDNDFYSGDTVFRDGIGRCDLYGGNEAVLRNTIKNLKIYFKNNPDLIIHPGHEDEADINYILNNNYYFSAY